MARRRVVGTGLVAVVCVFGLASTALGQQAQSGIAGAVKDAAGRPVAGVTVEASSPALIEKIRTVATDGQGQYKILDLVPGSYSVTFKAAGFSALRTEGVELTAGVTATVNAALRPGNPEQTVVVSGTAAVDTQNTRQQSVLSD